MLPTTPPDGTAHHGTAPVDPTNVVGRRIGAWIVDLLIYLAIALAVLFATGGVDLQSQSFATNADAEAFCERFNATEGQRFCSVADTEAVSFEIAGTNNGVFVVHLVAYILVQGIAGGSLGKLALGLRVVDIDGRQVGIGKSALRTLLWVVDAITLGFPIVGGVMLLSTKGHRRVGDMVAGTYVVRAAAVGAPLLVPGVNVPEGGAWSAGPASGPTAGTTPGFDQGPIWDEARETYLHYDDAEGTWLAWDNDTSTWQPMEQGPT